MLFKRHNVSIITTWVNRMPKVWIYWKSQNTNGKQIKPPTACPNITECPFPDSMYKTKDSSDFVSYQVLISVCMTGLCRTHKQIRAKTKSWEWYMADGVPNETLCIDDDEWAPSSKFAGCFQATPNYPQLWQVRICIWYSGICWNQGPKWQHATI